MKRNLYDLCNLIETDLSGYEGEALGELEIQKRKEALRRRAGVSGKRGRRLGTAAACVAASIFVLGPIPWKNDGNASACGQPFPFWVITWISRDSS